MATLKDYVIVSQVPDANCHFHEWKFMATLKVAYFREDISIAYYISMNENSWQHWRNGATSGGSGTPIIFPWMKIHGNIEGLRRWEGWYCPGLISMNENSWQHWREDKQVNNTGIPNNFHEWKFMATLKGPAAAHIPAVRQPFPWMKILGNIEGLLLYCCLSGLQFRSSVMSTLFHM